MGLSINDIQRLIGAFGPHIKFHPQEAYLMDDPDATLNSGLCALSRGLVDNENDYGSFDIRPGTQNTVPITSASALPALWNDAKNDPRKNDPAYRYWITINDVLKPGNQSRAKISVIVKQTDQHVDLEFWVYCPFNGPGKFRVTAGNVFTDYIQMDTCGRHYSDWEHVTVRLTPASTAQGWAIQSVYLSRHTFTVWISDLTKLQFSGTHPVIYSARDSHAHYPNVDEHHYYLRPWSLNIGIGTVAVDLYDMTADGGVTFDASLPNNYRITAFTVNGNSDPSVVPPPWYQFSGRWGQYEKLIYSYHLPLAGIDPVVYNYTEVGSGPVGPSQHSPDDFNFLSVNLVPYRNLEAIVAVAGNGLNHNWQDTSSHWSDWQNYSGVPPKTFSCVAASAAEGNIELFLIAQDDGTLYHSYLSGDNWGGFEANFNGAQKMKNVAVVGYQGQAEVLAVGRNGKLYHTWYGGKWGPWVENFQNASPNINLKSVTMVEAIGNVEGWAIGEDGTVYHNYLSPNWNWSTWDANFNGAPKAVDVSVIGFNGHIEVFLVGTNGHIYHSWFDGHSTWSPWQMDFQGAGGGLKSITMVGWNNLEVWLLGQDGTLYHNYLEGGNWHNWQANPFGAPKLRTIASAQWLGRVEVMGIGLDGNPVHNWFDGSWHAWETPFSTGGT